jgi:PAS domain S-box-containing protein
LHVLPLNLYLKKSKEVYLSNQKLVIAVSGLETLTIAVEQSPIIVLLTDIQGVVEYVNQSFMVISGYTKPQVMGKGIRSLGLILDTNPMEGIKYVMQNKVLWQGEIQGISTTKQIYKLKVSISPILDEAQNITHFSVQLRRCHPAKRKRRRRQDLQPCSS